MDREIILRILRENSFGVKVMNMDDIVLVTISFIIDSGRTESEARAFVTVLSNSIELRNMILDCYRIAIQHYEKKFAICKLYSAPNANALMGQERTLLSIF